MHSLRAGAFTNPTVQSVDRSVVIYMVLEASKNNGKITRKDSEGISQRSGMTLNSDPICFPGAS